MRASIRFAAAAAAALLAFPTEVIAQVRLPFSRQSRSSQSATQKRSLPVDLFSAESTYVVNATVGTPPQDVSFRLALSSYESWVPDTQYCDSDSYYYSRYEGCIYGSYNHNVSSTFVRSDNDDTFYAYDLNGNYAYGDRINETVGFATGQNVSSVSMGLASEASKWIGVMALGFNDSYSEESTILDQMLATGLINSTAYSLWVDQEDGATGHVLFGAIDKSAFDGTLKRFSVDRQHYDESTSYSYSNTFDVYIQGLNASQSSDGIFAPLFQNTSALPMVTIDPTASLSVLPEEIANAIWDLAGAKYDETYDSAVIPCSYRDNLTAELAIQLSSVDDGPIFNVPLSDLVLSEDSMSDILGYSYSYYSDDTTDNTTYCLFGVQMTNDTSYAYYSYEDNWMLGGGMLKRQYMVFDLANEDVAMAPVKFGASDPAESSADVVAFSQYGAKIPESTGEESRCYADDDDCNTSSSSGRYGSSASSSDSDGLSGDYIGMIVGFSILGAVMLGVAIWGIVRCCRDNNARGAGALPANKGVASAESVPAAATATTSPEAAQPTHNATATTA